MRQRTNKKKMFVLCWPLTAGHRSCDCNSPLSLIPMIISQQHLHILSTQKSNLVTECYCTATLKQKKIRNFICPLKVIKMAFIGVGI